MTSASERELAIALANFIDDDAGDHFEESFYSEVNLILTDMYSKYPFEAGRVISRKERKDNQFSSCSLMYGEVLSIPYLKEFSKLYRYGLQTVGGKFVDIGCGTGLAVFASALLHDFETCIGIEILEG